MANVAARAVAVAQRVQTRQLGQWAVTGSNRRPPACKAGALPAELTARTRQLGGSYAVHGTSEPRMLSEMVSTRGVAAGLLIADLPRTFPPARH
jgi:hypothetical protein